MLAVYFTHVVVYLCNKSAFTRTLQSLVATVVYYMWGFFSMTYVVQCLKVALPFLK